MTPYSIREQKRRKTAREKEASLLECQIKFIRMVVGQLPKKREYICHACGDSFKKHTYPESFGKYKALCDECYSELAK